MDRRVDLDLSAARDSNFEMIFCKTRGKRSVQVCSRLNALFLRFVIGSSLFVSTSTTTGLCFDFDLIRLLHRLTAIESCPSSD